MSYCECFLQFVGLITVIKLLFNFIKFFFGYFIYSYDLTKYGAGKGSWAVITGASDGIGKGFAEELAKAGFNLILVSRTDTKLRELAKELNSKYHIETDTIAIDVSSQDYLVISKVQEALEVSNRQITMLVNNVGVNTSYPVLFSEMSEADMLAQLQVNMVFPTRLTKLCLPYLLTNKKSAIIFLSSVLGQIDAAPYNSVYAGTKAYDAKLAGALHVELKKVGCDVLAISPAYVASSMTGIKRTSFLVRSPNETATTSFRWLGREMEITPAYSHVLFRWVLKSLPQSIVLPRMVSDMQFAAARIKKRLAQ